MKPLNAKDIEKLENTSVASAALAATAGNTTDVIGCEEGTICVVASDCLYNSVCEQNSCEISCQGTENCVATGCMQTVICGATCVATAGDDGAGTLGFSALLRAALK